MIPIRTACARSPILTGVFRSKIAVSQKLQPLAIYQRKMSSTEPTMAPGVELSPNQRSIVDSVLQLFAGNATKGNLANWTDDAYFADPITMAEGRKQFEAQWVGLAAIFSKIDILKKEVTSAGNPITLSTKVSYTVKGLGTEKTMESVVNVHTTGEEGSLKITGVEDKWNGQLPDGPIAHAFRKLNAVTVPLVTGAPKE